MDDASKEGALDRVLKNEFFEFESEDIRPFVSLVQPMLLNRLINAEDSADREKYFEQFLKFHFQYPIALESQDYLQRFNKGVTFMGEKVKEMGKKVEKVFFTTDKILSLYYNNKIDKGEMKTILNAIKNHPILIHRFKSTLESRLNKLFEHLSLEDGFKILETIHGDQLFSAENIKKFNKNDYVLDPSRDNIFLVLSNSLLDHFFALVASNPKEALRLLKNSKDLIGNVRYNLYDLIPQIDLLNVSDKEDADLAECMAILAEKGCFVDVITNVTPMYSTINKVRRLVLSGRTDTICQIVKMMGEKCDKEEVIKCLIKVDNAKCLEKVMEIWRNDPSLKKMIIEELAKAVYAPQCVALLSPHLEKSSRETLLKAAVERGCAEIVLILCDNDEKRAATILFSDLTPSKITLKLIEDIGSRVCKILRFSKMEIADKVINAFIKLHPNDENALRSICDAAKEKYLKVSPFFAHHVQTDSLSFIKGGYNNQLNLNDKAYEEDLKYGDSCRKKVEELEKQLRSDSKPSEKDFLTLPPSKSGSRMGAFLLEKIAEFRSQKQKDRAQGFKADLFASLREEMPGKTDITDHIAYGFGTELAGAVRQFSKADDLEKTTHGYNTKYHGMTMTKVRKLEGKAFWEHGVQPVKISWSFVEECLEEILKMDLKKPENLRIFYDKLCELVWLIGNTQPLLRGSGSVAEFIFAIAHIKHGLKVPTLKKDFPQLDVSDISFPLSDYKKFFTYIFEPKTLPQGVQRRQYSGPVFHQLKSLYAEPS